jgi:hypothetical protein
MDYVWENPGPVREWGEAGRARYFAFDISWARVIEKLLT